MYKSNVEVLYDDLYTDLKIIENSIFLTKDYEYQEENNNIKIACAKFDFKEGWHILDIQTFQPFSNAIQSYYAGYLEGYIYHELIGYHYTNIYKTLFNNTELDEDLKSYLNKQEDYYRNLINISENENQELSQNIDSEKEYYLTMKYIVYQFDGLLKGQKDGALKYGKNPLTKQQLYYIAMQADMNDLLQAFRSKNLKTTKKPFEKIMNNHQDDINLKFLQEKECSGFVRYVKEENNLISAHTTHNIYVLLNRIFKNYDFNLRLNNKKLNTYKFSSRPGDLNSKDDYYTLSNNMLVIETSLDILDHSLYKNLKFETVPKWIRINIANKLAKNNIHWTELFFKHNSGTHNNQWLIVDYNKFEEYLQKAKKINTQLNTLTNGNLDFDIYLRSHLNFTEASKKENITDETDDFTEENLNIIHLVEQIPVLEKAYYKDFSKELINNGYVASYNAPYFQEVIELAGYKKYNQSDYFTAKRNFIFKKFSNKIKTIDDTKILMRFHDEENMCDTIAPRCDLVKNIPFGSVDAKITDRFKLKEMKSQIIYGPPYIKGISEPFDFTKFSNYSHLGIPDYFDYDWIEA